MSRYVSIKKISIERDQCCEKRFGKTSWELKNSNDPKKIYRLLVFKFLILSFVRCSNNDTS